MSLWMMGGGAWQPPFNRTFFNVVLGEILRKAGKEKGSRLTLYLVDGTQLDVRSIEDLSDQYLTLNAGARDEDDFELSLHVLPYSSIYRLEVASTKDDKSRRVGFRWTPLGENGRAGRKVQTKGPPSSQSVEELPAEGALT